MLKLNHFVSAIIVMMTCFAASVFACDCLDETPQQSFERADTVFEGNVVWIGPSEKYTNTVFEVRKILKGTTSKQIVTSSLNFDCDFEFVRSGIYRVYARKYDNVLRVDSCSATEGIGNTLSLRSSNWQSTVNYLVLLTEASLLIFLVFLMVKRRRLRARV